MPPDDHADGNRSVTSLLAELNRGNQDAQSKFAALIYGELRRLAAGYMRRERPNHTLQPTALVHEAWERLAAQQDIAWRDRVHFFAFASQHMRQILVDHARKRRAAKRGGVQQKVTLHDHMAAGQADIVDVIVLNEAMERLHALDARACRIVELHFFGGLSFDEIAAVLDISLRTAQRDWNMARAWLQKELSRSK